MLDIEPSGEVALALTSQVHITLSSNDVIVKAPAPPIQELSGGLPVSVAIGGPVILAIDNEFVKADPHLATYLEEHHEVDFVLATFALSFSNVQPRIVSATAAFSLRRSDGTEDPKIIALSLYPQMESDEVSIKRTLSAGIRLGPNLTLTAGSAASGDRSRPLIEGFGELTSNPSWHLYDRPNRPILGAYRLAVVIQLPHEVNAQARISVTVLQKGTIRHKFQSGEIVVPITTVADKA